jgi:preprotein translocase subunit SecY
MVNFEIKNVKQQRLIVTGLMLLIFSLGGIIPIIIPVNPFVTVFSSLYIGIIFVCSYAYLRKRYIRNNYS